MDPNRNTGLYGKACKNSKQYRYTGIYNWNNYSLKSAAVPWLCFLLGYSHSRPVWKILNNFRFENKSKTKICNETINEGKFETNIPRNETERTRSEFLHSCICEWFIYSHDRSAYFAVLRLRTDRGLILIAPRYMNLKIGNEAVSFLGIFVANFRYKAFAVCASAASNKKWPGHSIADIPAEHPPWPLPSLYRTIQHLDR